MNNDGFSFLCISYSFPTATIERYRSKSQFVTLLLKKKEKN